jgi:hydrogenase accessory protein HypB
MTDRAPQKVEIGKKVLSRNDEIAAGNRAFFQKEKLLVINLISSPGSGKTTLLERMAERLKTQMAVIEGDIRTRRDAERVEKAGSPAYQIETAGACHLDAASIEKALKAMNFSGVKVVVIENVGNLVCPASYDLGEDFKAAILSAAEGDDKVMKYPVQLGVQLFVVPHTCGDSGDLILEIIPKTERLDPSFPAPAGATFPAGFIYYGGNVAAPTLMLPQTRTKTVVTRMMMQSGDTGVIGGLLDDTETKASAWVPVLGKIPMLGYLFKQNTKTKTTNNTTIFITPTILRTDGDVRIKDQIEQIRNLVATSGVAEPVSTEAEKVKAAVTK